MLIGLPASGKSTVSIELARKYDANVHSSDELRLELFGSYNVQDKNTELFEELHDRIVGDLSSGKSVIYDATNLSMKRRRHFLSQMPSNVENIAVIVATPIEICLLRDEHRKKKVGSKVINRMWNSFQFPICGEGFDDIKIIYTGKVNKIDRFAKYIYLADNFPQDNPNHTLTVGRHMRKSFDYYCYNCDNRTQHDNVLLSAIILHDISKPWAKTFKDKNGIMTDVAKYYGHENMGSYESLFCNAFAENDEETIETAQLIQYHMRHYGLNSSKSVNKFKKLVGEKMYEDLLIINQCDKMGK